MKRLLLVMVMLGCVGCGSTDDGTEKSAREIADERNEAWVDPESEAELINCAGETANTVVHVCNMGQGSTMTPCLWDVFPGDELKCDCLTEDYQVEHALENRCTK